MLLEYLVLLVVVTQCKGSVLIHQKMFESRLFFTDKLIDMGAQIILCDPHRAVVIGHDHKFQLRANRMLIRVAMVPAFAATVVFMRDLAVLGALVPAIIYLLTALTDMLDGKIARKYNMITDFGKFIDPLADKFMVLASLAAMLLTMALRGDRAEAIVFTFVYLVILLRELGVTSLRLVVAGQKVVVAASMLGKIKTVSQMVGTLVILLEPLVFPFSAESHIVAYIMMGVMALWPSRRSSRESIISKNCFLILTRTPDRFCKGDPDEIGTRYL